MSLWAVVPVKPLTEAKSRLSPVLSQPERAALVLAMLQRTLRVLVRVDALFGVLVVSDDARVRSTAAEVGGVHYLRETGSGGLNAALSQASGHAGALGATGLLVVPGDLPRLCPSSIRSMLDRSAPPEVAIAPDRTGEGTNALLVAPPEWIPFSFGGRSFQAHVAKARARGVEPRIVRDCRLAADLDRPEDLALAEGLIPLDKEEIQGS
jgi:2-phospho-L-lactate guanylyltransferase